MKILKILGIILGSLVALVLLGVGVIYAIGGSKIGKKHTVAVAAATITIPTDSASIARGMHLASSVNICVECHATDLGGKEMGPPSPFAILNAPNITRGRGGKGATLTDADLVRAIRHGLRTDSTSLVIMPAEHYVHMTDQDLGAVIAYVKSVPPVDREFPQTKLQFLGRMLLGAGMAPVLTAETAALENASRAVIPPGPTAEYGKYMVSISGCTACHGKALSGGVSPGGPPDAPASANLTPKGRLATWTEEGFIKTMREGMRPDGAPLNPDVMPWKNYKGMTDDELRAIWAYLKTVPGKDLGVQSNE